VIIILKMGKKESMMIETREWSKTSDKSPEAKEMKHI
jgi:hypothetical protein